MEKGGPPGLSKFLEIFYDWRSTIGDIRLRSFPGRGFSLGQKAVGWDGWFWLISYLANYHINKVKSLVIMSAKIIDKLHKNENNERIVQKENLKFTKEVLDEKLILHFCF